MYIAKAVVLYYARTVVWMSSPAMVTYLCRATDLLMLSELFVLSVVFILGLRVRILLPTKKHWLPVPSYSSVELTLDMTSLS